MMGIIKVDREKQKKKLIFKYFTVGYLCGIISYAVVNGGTFFKMFKALIGMWVGIAFGMLLVYLDGIMTGAVK